MQWYYALNGQRQGPVPQAEFERLVHAGTITPDTLVWRQGMANWQALSELLAIDPSIVPPAPPPVPVAAFPTEPVAPAWSTPASEPRYAPGSVLSPVGAEVRYGGFWLRFLARVIDGVILGVVSQVLISIVMAAFFSGVTAVLQNPPHGEPSAEQLGALIGAFVVFMSVSFPVSTVLGLVYEWFFLKRFAATPGKLVFGLKVYRADGSPLSLGRIVGRHFAYMINGFTLGIGWIIAGFDDQKRALHDHICDTRVIKSR